MIIEDPEAFKSWLTTILEPLCDADPAALAKYVYALVKKDKPIPELRGSMLSQLEVFLLEETVSFVDMLFDKLLSGNNQETGAGSLVETNATVVGTAAAAASSLTGGSLSALSGSVGSTSLSGSLPGSFDAIPVKIKIEPNLDKPLSPSQETAVSIVEQAPSVDVLEKVKESEKEVKDKEKERDHEKERIDHERDLKEKERERLAREARDREREKDRDDKRSGASTVLGPKDNVPLSNGQSVSALVSAPVSKRDVERRSPHRSPHRIRDRNKSDSEKDDRPLNSRMSRPSRRTSSPRFRSRSRSWERRHSRRSRSRDRDRDESRAWRNVSPPSRRYDRDRRRSWSKSPPIRRDRMMSRSRSRSRSRSPVKQPNKSRPGRYRNRSPPIPRSPSYSPRDKGSRFDSDPLSGPATPTQDSNHEPDLRLNLASQSIQSVVSVKDQSYLAKERCRDFDEKGFCMQGDLCLFDHGADPVVLEDVTLPDVLQSYRSNNLTSMPAPGAELMGPQNIIRPPVNLPVPPNNLPGVITQLRPALNRPQLNSATEYNPDAPSMEPRMMWGRAPFRPPAVRGAVRGARSTSMTSGHIYTNYSAHQRELVHVETNSAVVPYSHANNFHNDLTGMGGNVVQRRTNFDFNRLGGVRRGGGMAGIHPPSRDNCSLELKRVPRELNNITQLNNHFSKYGNIVNIQVCFEGDSEAALITFSNHSEAYSAFRSTEAVLNNRFIRVLWHTNEGKQENVPPRRPSVKERLGAPVTTPAPSKVLNTLQPSAIQTKEEKPSSDKVLDGKSINRSYTKVVYSGNNLTKTMYIPTALKKSENLQITTIVPQEKKLSLVTRPGIYKKTHEIRAVKETLKKKQEEKRKEAIKLTADLRKRKQELLDKQLKEQKLLIERVEKGGVLPEQREAIMKTLKTLQQSIEKIRKDLASVVTKMNVSKSSGPVKVTPEMVKKTHEETQRQILDAELDIFNQQQEGKDTTHLQKRVLELKMHAKTLGLLNSGTPLTNFPSRGKFRSSRGRTTFPHSSVDHRPTKLLVENFGKISRTDVLAHFAQFGEIAEYDFPENGKDSLILSFKSRKEAENAISKGLSIGDCPLSVTWFKETPVTSHDNNNTHRSIVLMCGEEEEEEEEEEGEEEEDDDDDDEDDEEEEEEVDLLEGGDEDGDELQLEDLGEELLFQEEDQDEEEDEERSWRR